ncbi:MAG: GNAT family N-acetyltransferase [Synechococcales cyanobacterium RM1_1_8]|nr:GNAT family N-acetyltransferase [Synechococcales cyanobacterium RM1_1_8]
MIDLATVQIRPFETGDRNFILSLIPRFIEKAMPPGRAPIQVIAGIERPLLDFMEERPPIHALLIAEHTTIENKTQRLGFIYLQPQVDGFSRERHGHVSDIAITAEAEGSGLGRLLMAEAELWARTKGYRFLTLNAFAANGAVRRWYEDQGYEPDMVRYFKPLTQ